MNINHFNLYIMKRLSNQQLIMKSKVYFYVILFYLFISCTENNQYNTTYLVKKTEIQQYNSDKLSDIVEYFDIVPLETSDDCLLGEINVIKKRAGRYYIRTNDNRLDVFNENGKHLMKVGGVGQGPGEYTAICDFDADNDHIYILVPGKILKYDYNGTFQTELPIENLQWGHLRRIKNGFLIQCVQPLPDGNGLIYADDKGHVIQTAMSVGEHTHLKGNLAWTEWNEEYYFYHLSTSNDLYCYDVESQNFSSKTLVEDKNALSADEYIQKKEKGLKLDEIKEKMIMGIASSRSQVVWGTMENKGKEISYNVYDKDSGKTASFDIFKITDDLTFPNNMNEIMLLGLLPLNDSDDDCFVSYIDASMLKEKAEEKGLLSSAPYNKLNDIPEDSNPAIIRLKFK